MASAKVWLLFGSAASPFVLLSLSSMPEKDLTSCDSIYSAARPLHHPARNGSRHCPGCAHPLARQRDHRVLLASLHSLRYDPVTLALR